MKRTLRVAVVADANSTIEVVRSTGNRFYGFIILLLMVCGVMRGQTVTIGSGTNQGQKLPVVPYFHYSFSEQIIPQTEIATSGTITKLRFYSLGATLTDSNNWTIYLGHTAKTSFTSNTDWILSGAMTQVFSGTVTAVSGGGWMEVTLSTPFNYNNTNNLVVAVDENATSYALGSTTNYFRIFTPATGNQAIYFQSDSANPDPASMTSLSGARVNYRNQMQLVFETLTPCSGTPIAGTVAVSPTSDAPSSTYTVSATGYSSGATGLNYQWQSNTDGAGWVNSGSATTSYSNRTAIAPTTAGSTVQWRLRVTCTDSGLSSNSTTSTFTVAAIWNVPATSNNSITTCTGSLYDSGGSTNPYSNGADGYTIINPSTPGAMVRISGSITTEAGYDYLTIYDGSGTGGSILWGGFAHGSGTSCATFTVPTITSTTGPLTVRFTSDGSGNCAGFALNVSCFTPSATPSLAITGTTAHGTTCPLTATTSQTYTITNTGTTAASGITVVSSDSQFVVSGLSSTTIAGSGGTATYTVTFTPSSAGAKTATITVASTTVGSNSPTSSLTGTGTPTVTPTVTTAAATAVAVTTATLNASASTFGTCPNTTVKGFVISQTSTNANPLIGGSGVTNEAVTVLGTQGAFLKAITGLLPGTQYSYKAYLYDGTTYTYGAVQTFTTLSPPANDLCADAIDLVVNAAAVSGTMANATTTSAIDSYPDVWYKFTPSCIGKYTITLSGFTGDLDLYYFTSCGTTSPAGSVSTTANPEILVTSSTLSASTTYYVRVRAFNPAVSTSTFTIAVSNQMNIFTHPTSISVVSGATATFASSMPANQTGYQWQVNTGSGWGNVTSGTGATTNSYTTAATTLAMSGYQYRVVISNGTCNTVTSNAATLTVTNCTPVSTNNVDYISGFSTTGGITNITNTPTTHSTGGYGNYYATHSASQTAGLSLNFTETYNEGNHGFKIWVDWNKDGDFATSEVVYTPSASATGFTSNFTIPFTTAAGDYRMRIRAVYSATGLPTTLDPCGSVTYGEGEDYKLIVFASTTDTRLNFASTTYTIAENNGTVNLCVDIMNPSPTVATTANIVKTTVTGTHISTTTYPITFPAGSSTQQCVSIAITDNTNCNDTSAYTFELQSVSGGISAMAGPLNPAILTVNDNDSSSGIFRKLDFEGCDTWSYTSVGGTLLVTDDTNRYAGTKSLRIGGSTASTITTENISLTGYSNVSVSMKYAATGVDPGEDLFLEVSYDNGTTWTGTGSIQLYDGFDNTGLAMGNTNAYSQTNPYTFNVSPSETQIRLRFKTNAGMSAEYYYIDDITLTGNGCNVSPTYGVPTSTTASTYYINNVKFQGINAVQNLANGYSSSPSGYQNWTSITKTIQSQGEPINVSLDANTPVHWKAWVDWNKDGLFNATTEEVYSNGTYTGQFSEFGFIVPVSTAPGDYRIRFRVSYDTSSFTACTNIANGEAEDYLFTVIASCSALITNVTDGETCGSGPVDLVVTATGSPTQYRWYTTETGGSPLATTTTSSWTTPTITTTTTYYVTAFNGCESNIRTAIVATISPLPTLTFNNPNPVVCGESSVIELAASGDKQEVVLFDEKFNSGLGLFENINADTNNPSFDNLTNWTNKTSTYLPEGDLWTPAISSGIAGNKFAFATSDIIPDTAPNNIENSLTLITGVNTTDFLNLTLTMRVFYSRYLNDGNSIYSGTYYRDDLKVEVSTNGTTWTTLATYDSDLGIGNKFATLSFTLPSTYLNVTNFKVRVRHYSSSSSTLYFPGGVAVDDIKLYGEKELNTAFGWTSIPAINAYNDVACTDLYDPLTDEANTIYFKPTVAQLVNPTFTITANAELSNGCTATDNITITNNTKLWTGSLSNDWSVPGNWLPNGVPNNTHCIIINDVDALVIPSLANGFGKNLIVKSIGSLTINPNASLTVTEDITVEPTGLLEIKDSGSLVQVTDPPLNAALNSINNNTGEIRMERISKPMYKMDYTYWSSPVTEDSNFTLYDLSDETPSTKFYKWGHEATTPNWVMILNGTEAMVPGRGYIVRAPLNFDFPPETTTASPGIYTANFDGKPNNGVIRHNVTGSIVADKWNLIGNPYPSAISADKFLLLNADPLLNTVLSGTLYFWTHNTSIAEIAPGAGIYTYNAGDYASWNKTGGTSTRAATDVANGGVPGDNTINNAIPSGYIAAGQAFFAKGIETGAVIFNNDMRVATQNNQFFRPGTPEPINNWDTTGKHRVWLNLKGETKGFCQTLVGYIENATNDLDNLYDGDSFGGNQVTFYSVLDTKKLVIQGRALPFNNQDQVPLGYKTSLTGILTISIDDFDGLFSGQNIYLEDKLLNIVHDLKAYAYNFTTAPGTFDERFVLRYLPAEELSIPGQEALAESVLLFQEQNAVFIKSPLENLEQVTIYDLLGRVVYQKSKIGATEWHAQDIVMNEQTLIVKIILENGQIINKKIIY